MLVPCSSILGPRASLLGSLVLERQYTLQDFSNKVAVITGAASGIGRAIANRFARDCMGLVLADIEDEPLAIAAEELKAAGADVLAVPTDVSNALSVQALSDAAFERFGAVHLLFNNAGVGVAGAVWENSIADWQWVFGVNLWGVIHGIKSFVPRMMEQNTECWIVNTASVAGLITGPGMGVYNVTKHGVVALSETLHYDLEEAGSLVKVSVLCPAWVKTRIMDSSRNRSGYVPDPNRTLPPWVEARRQAIEGGLSADYVAECVIDAIREDRFYIFTHPEAMPLVQARMNGILTGQNPVNPAIAALKLSQNTGAKLS